MFACNVCHSNDLRIRDNTLRCPGCNRIAYHLRDDGVVDANTDDIDWVNAYEVETAPVSQSEFDLIKSEASTRNKDCCGQPMVTSTICVDEWRNYECRGCKRVVPLFEGE